jgi:hypothetical protein
MATPADQRLLELLDKWLKSLELHSKYSSLDDDSYWKVQPWVEHQRPTRWILDLARQKTLALKAQVEERVKSSDTKFSDSLELMIFLANLVGSEHIERFIPVADPDNERSLKPAKGEAAATAVTGTREMPKFPPDVAKASENAVTATREMPLFTADKKAAGESSITATREMPKFPTARGASTPPPAATPHVVRTERKTAAPTPKPATKGASKANAKPAAAKEKGDPKDQVIADAVRLVQWGRKWYELAELIARMADRPALPEVRRILKENKAAIEKQAGAR